MSTLDAKIAVMQAHVAGEQIQFRPTGSTDWHDAMFSPLWNWEITEYRIRPDEPIEINLLAYITMRGTLIWIDENKSKFLPTKVYARVPLEDKTVSAEVLR